MTEKKNSFVSAKLREVKDPELRKSMDRIYRKQATIFRSTNDVHEIASTEIDESLRAKIIQADTKPKQLKLGLLPTDLCRVSPFRPLRRRDMGSIDVSLAREFPQPGDDLKQSWGKLVFYGPDVAAREEDLLIVLLVRWVRNNGESFACNYSNLLDDLEYKRGTNNKHHPAAYRSLKESLIRLRRSKFELSVNQEGKDKTKGKDVWLLETTWDDQAEKLTVKIHSWFGTEIGFSLVTGVNLAERKQIKGDIAKFLHRFISSHRTNTQFHSVKNLANALGMNPDQPDKIIKQKLGFAIKELKRIGFLTNRTKITDNKLTWYRKQKVLGGPKLIEQIKKGKREG